MTMSGIARLAVMSVCFAVPGVLLAPLAVAQGQQPYESKGYTASPPAEVDKNFGLPSFGMPGAELPQMKTMAPEPVTPEKPDFFKDATEIPLPRNRPVEIPGRASISTGSGTSYGSGMETPLFTTSQGSTTGSASALLGDTYTTTGNRAGSYDTTTDGGTTDTMTTR